MVWKCSLNLLASLRQLQTCLRPALITTRPPKVEALAESTLKVSISSRTITCFTSCMFDSQSTWVSSLETVSRFFSKNPFTSYSTVSEKCFMKKPKKGRN